MFCFFFIFCIVSETDSIVLFCFLRVIENTSYIEKLHPTFSTESGREKMKRSRKDKYESEDLGSGNIQKDGRGSIERIKK